MPGGSGVSDGAFPTSKVLAFAKPFGPKCGCAWLEFWFCNCACDLDIGDVGTSSAASDVGATAHGDGGPVDACMGDEPGAV